MLVVSGEAASEPVVSAKTGTVYERRLLEKYAAEHSGREPQTDHVLGEDEIIAVRTDPPAVRPRPPTLTSIPALLSTFQNEWDALVLETFTLKQQHTQVRQELAQALYQNDAACRVIARLVRERDEARQALATLQAQVPATNAAAAIGSDTQGGGGSGARQEAPPAGDRGTTMDVDGAAGDEEPRSAEEKYYATAAETAKRLSAVRMKREAPAGLVSAEAWKTARVASVVESLHTSTKPGITSLQTDGTGDLALTGAMDNHAEVYSRSRDLTLATLKGHTKKLTAAVWAAKGGSDLVSGGFGARIITGSADKSVRVWVPKPGNAQAAEGTAEALDLRAVGWTKLCVIKEHAAEIAGITVHPSGEYFATAAVDGSWAIHTIDGDTIVSETLGAPLTAIAYHPDGMFLGIGTAAGQVKVLDVRQRQVLATLDASPGSSGDPAPVRGLHFSENGYYFATTCDHEVAIWDLRKQKKSRSWTCADLQDSPDTPPFAAPARFDGSGKYLAIVHGRSLLVFKVKGWQLLASVEMASAAAADGSSDPKTHSTLADDAVEAIDWIGSSSSAVAGATKLNSLIYFAPSENN
ncbi:hypothetical protein H4S06_002136 [Coemansia sp. BCRC 34490]|nr:hypothetical protein H4S06_002136 [Coemansia sp. BCRC 34490]